MLKLLKWNCIMISACLKMNVSWCHLCVWSHPECFFFFFNKHGACVNAMDLWQFTPLHEAASKNRVEVCSLLLSHGADPTLVNCHGKSAVDMAPTPELKERLTCEFIFYLRLQNYSISGSVGFLLVTKAAFIMLSCAWMKKTTTVMF